MWPDDETPEPAAWINFNAATGERNVSFICESELASIPLWPEPPRGRKPLTQGEVVEGFCKEPHSVQYVSVFNAGVRFAERHHDIKGGQHGAE